MKRTINLPSLSILSTLVLLSCAVSNLAQNREKYVISAKAGGINAVTGQAAMHGKGESDWQQITVTDDLQAGDRVRTAQDGRVEILLNPGSYLRLGGDSEVELADNSLDNLELRLLRGTAIVEATGMEESQMLINISTPHAKLAIDRQGLYRLNVIPNDATELIVRKGRVILGDSHTKVKGGNKVIFNATSISVAKLTNEEKKFEKQLALEQWSQVRAKTLAKANSRINNRMLGNAFAGMSNSFFYSGLRSGFWFYNASAACYTFLPVGYGYSSSPYGIYYRTTIFAGPRISSGGYYGSAGLPASSSGRPQPSTGSSYPSSSGAASSMPVRTGPVSAPPRNMDSIGPRMTRKEMPLEPGKP